MLLLPGDPPRPEQNLPAQAPVIHNAAATTVPREPLPRSNALRYRRFPDFDQALTKALKLVGLRRGSSTTFVIRNRNKPSAPPLGVSFSCRSVAPPKSSRQSPRARKDSGTARYIRIVNVVLPLPPPASPLPDACVVFLAKTKMQYDDLRV